MHIPMVNLTNASRKILSSAALLRCLLSMMYVGQALFHTIHYRQVHVRCPALILFCFSLQGETIIEWEKLELHKGHWSLENRKDNFRMRL